MSIFRTLHPTWYKNSPMTDSKSNKPLAQSALRHLYDTLPYDLSKAITFCLFDPFVQSLVESSANRFFKTMVNPPCTSSSRVGEGDADMIKGRLDGISNDQEMTAQVIIDSSDGGSWALLPLDWREFFEDIAARTIETVGENGVKDDRETILSELADGLFASTRSNVPGSLKEFLSNCRRFSLERTCSSKPVLTFTTLATSPATLSSEDCGSHYPSLSSSRPTSIGYSLEDVTKAIAAESTNPDHKEGVIELSGGSTNDSKNVENPGSSTFGMPEKKRMNNSETIGVSPKKFHEIHQFASLVSSMTNDSQEDTLNSNPISPTIATTLTRAATTLVGRKKSKYMIDLGSGRAHLSRLLSSTPYNFEVLALDFDEQQIKGAKFIEYRKAKSKQKQYKKELSENTGKHEKEELQPDTTSQKSHLGRNAMAGSLTHRTSRLDANAIIKAMDTWPDYNEQGTNHGQEGHDGFTKSHEPNVSSGMLVALHACGDLTVHTLEAFIQAQKQATSASNGARSSGREKVTYESMVAVGCCYNIMTPSNFPLSNIVSSKQINLRQCKGKRWSSDQISSSSLSSAGSLHRSHLRLTPQSPPNWYTNPESLSISIKQLAFRARFEAELNFWKESSPLSKGSTDDKARDEKGKTPVDVEDRRSSSPIRAQRVGRISNKDQLRSYQTYRESAKKKYTLKEGEEGIPYNAQVIPLQITKFGIVEGTKEKGSKVNHNAGDPNLPLPFPSRGNRNHEEEEQEDELNQAREWRRSIFLLQVFWTLRSWLGPPIESLLVLDRFLYLSERLQEQQEQFQRSEEDPKTRERSLTEEREVEGARKPPHRYKVELVNLFEQKTGSLRNLALVVR